MIRLVEGENYFITYDNPMRSSFTKDQEVKVVRVDCAGNATVRGVGVHTETTAHLYPSQLTDIIPEDIRRRSSTARKRAQCMADNATEDEILELKLLRMGI